VGRMAGARWRRYGRIVRRLRASVAALPAADRLLAVGLTAGYQLEVWVLGGGTAPRVLASAAGLLMTVPMAIRRRRPLLAVAGAALGFAAVLAASDVSSDDDAFVPWLVMLVAAYTAGRFTHGRDALIGALLTVTFPAVLAVTDRDGFNLGNFLFFAFIAVPPYLAGVAIARRRGHEAALERHAATLDAERERLAAEAVTQERARIARELHDVVAHGVSTMVVQAQGGARIVRTEPNEAETAFAAIERTGGQALTEMRRLLGILRAADDDAALLPQPGIERLGDLVEDLRLAGLPVEVHVEGHATTLPPGVNVSAYRIVQEALTNALKHAGPARAQVHLRYLPGAIELEVSDDGTGPPPDQTTGGHGLIDMRERVSIYGGRLEAGARASGGYRIRAWLPFEAARR
jgi:signal transduction histidine kinase